MQHFLAILLGFLRSIFRHATVFNTHFRRKASRSLIFLDFCHLSIACSGEILFEAIQETTPWFELWLGWYAKSEHVFLKLFLKNDDNDPCTSKFEFQSLSPACCLHDGSLLIVCEICSAHILQLLSEDTAVCSEVMRNPVILSILTFCVVFWRVE